MNDYSEFPLPLDENGIPIDPLPPTANQVMDYARAIKATPEIFAIFERMGDWGLPTNEEFDRLEEFRDGWLKAHSMDELNLNGIFGAYMLLRKIRWGQIDGLGTPEAMEFLREDEPRNTIVRARAPGGGGITAIPMRVEEIMWLADNVWGAPAAGDLGMTFRKQLEADSPNSVEIKSGTKWGSNDVLERIAA